MANYRNRKLLDLAHGIHECQVQIPGVCQGYTPEGCEPAHSNQQRHGRGMAYKSHDVFFAASCHACHMEIDHGSKLARSDREWYWQQGFDQTMLALFSSGKVVVA